MIRKTGVGQVVETQTEDAGLRKQASVDPWDTSDAEALERENNAADAEDADNQ